MPEMCGKSVNYLRNGARTTCLFPSTISLLRSFSAEIGGVKDMFIHPALHGFTPNLSPAKIDILPLSEHYFYPVSTVPTNTSSN